EFDILVCLNGVLDVGEVYPPLPDGSPNPINGNTTPPDECTGGTRMLYVPGNATPGFQGGVFAAAANTTYEVRVLPLFVQTPGSDYNGCAEYTDVNNTATSCAPTPIVTPPPISSSEFVMCNDT